MPFGSENNVVPGMTKRDLLYILFRRKRLILTFFWSTVIAALLYVLAATPNYESTGKLLIRVGRESATLDATAALGKTVTVAASMQQVVKSELEILNSQEMAEKVVDSIGISAILDPPPDPPQAGAAPGFSAFGDTFKNFRKASQFYFKKVKQKLGLVLGDLTPRQRATKKLMTNLDPEGVYESNIIVITADAETRTMAQRILQELLKFYMEKHLEVYKTLGSVDFFVAQAETLEGVIAEKDAQLQKLKNDSKIVSLDIQQTAVAQRIAALENSIQDAKTRLASGQARLDTIAAMRRQNSPSGRWQVQKLVNDQDELAQKNDIDVVRAQLATYQVQLAAAEEERRKITDSEGRIQQLTRELDTARVAYKSYTDNIEQARVESALTQERISNVGIAEPPSLPIEKESPMALIDLALGVFVGLFGGLGLAFLVEYYDTSVKSPEDVEGHLGVTTLATVPWVRRFKGQEATMSASALPAPFVRSMRTLAERLTLPVEGGAGRPRVIGVTSAYPHEGVTTIAAHLASILAQGDAARVLLVDANQSDPSIHAIFDSPVEPGLREAMAGGEASVALYRTALPRLQVLPVGERHGPQMTFEDDGFTKLAAEWRRHHDFIIVDMPSFGGPSTARLASRLDGVVVVVETDRARVPVVKRLTDRLAEVSAKTLGVVLNKRRYPIPTWLYRRM